MQTIYYDSSNTSHFARAGQGIDWNLVNGVETVTLAPLSINRNTAFESLKSSDDWGNLVYGFQNSIAMTDGEIDFTVPRPVEVDDAQLVSHALPTTEICDGFDNDGDGLVDEGSIGTATGSPTASIHAPRGRASTRRRPSSPRRRTSP